MPQAIAAAIVSALALTGLAATIATAVITLAVTLGISFLAQSLLGGTGGARSETSERSVKSPTPARVRCRGRRRLYGSQMLFDTASNGSTVDVWAFNDGRGTIIAEYLNDEQVTVSSGFVQQGADGRYGGATVQLGHNTGAPTETAFFAVNVLVPSLWTSAHRGDGIVSGYLIKKSVKSNDFLKVYPQGDNVTLSLVGDWGWCFDPRNPSHDPLDRSTWSFTENAALHLLDHYLSDRGYSYAVKIAPVVAYWIAAANVCDEPVPLAGGGTEPRYRACVAYDFTKAPADVVSEMLSCFDGWTGQDANGCQIVYAGKLYTPTVTIGPDQIVGYSHQEFVEDEDRVNELIVQYVSSEHDYNTVEGQAWRDEDDISARGKVNSDGLTLQVPSFPQVRRLAKRAMAKRCAPHRGTVVTTVEGRSILGHRYINLHIEEAGAVFYSGRAEIVSAERDYDTGGVSFTWLAADPNVDAWNAATEEGEAAPVGNRIALAPLDAPTITSASAIFESATDEGTGVRINVQAEGPDRADLTWYARWRVDGSVSWNEAAYPDIDPGPDAEMLTGFVPANSDIEVAVAYSVGDGRVSPYSAIVTVDTATDAVAPDDAVSITLDSWTNAINLSTPAIPRAASYRWRFYADDGATLIRTLSTSGRTVSYTASQAVLDGALRSYVVKVAGVNAAGAGAEAATGVISKAAPDAVSSPAIVGGTTTATATCDAEAGATGYAVFYSDTTGFDPETEGGVVRSGLPSISIFGLGAATYYGRIAAFDEWSSNPAHLNLSSEISFTITTGGGSTPSGGGSGGGGYGGGLGNQQAL